jgi:large subunit ribosomal protein L27
LTLLEVAHKKAGGKVRQGKRTAGKRLGLKVSGGTRVKTGQIILRQRGSTVRADEGVGTGKDYTLFAKRSGVVKFGYINKNKKKVSVT